MLLLIPSTLPEGTPLESAWSDRDSVMNVPAKLDLRARERVNMSR
jgi:hypothetical protein